MLNIVRFNKKKRSSGFTIVELLIVIVVIGILAALVLNTFSGVQRRARNTQTIANIRQFQNALEAYYAVAGEYPVADGEGIETIAMVCIGTGYPGGQCGEITGTDVFESPNLHSQLRDVLGGGINSQTINTIPGNVGSESFVGGAYGIDNWLHGGQGRTIQWFLEGEDQNCVLPKSYDYNTSNGNTACEIAIEPYP